MKCEIYNAKISRRQCFYNVLACSVGRYLILEQGVHPSELPDTVLDRVINCSKCIGLDLSSTKQKISQEVRDTVDKIENMDWDRGDEEESRLKRNAKYKRYRLRKKQGLVGILGSRTRSEDQPQEEHSVSQDST